MNYKFIIILLILLFSIGSASAGVNLLTENQANGGESGTISGFGGSVSTSISYAWQGTHSIYKSTSIDSIYTTKTLILPNTDYVSSAYIVGSGEFPINISLRFLDSGDNVLSETTNGPYYFTDAEWQRINVTATSDSDAASVVILIWDSGEDLNSVYGDGFQLENGTEPTEWVAGVSPPTPPVSAPPGNSVVLQQGAFIDFNLWLVIFATGIVLLFVSRILAKDSSGSLLTAMMSFLLLIAATWMSLSIAVITHSVGQTVVINGTTMNYAFPIYQSMASRGLTAICIVVTILAFLNLVDLFLLMLQSPPKEDQKKGRGVVIKGKLVNI